MGWVAVKKDTLIEENHGLTPENALSRNIDGELYAAFDAARWAHEKGKTACIFHDYLGISHWVEGKWKAKSEVAKDYVQKMEKFKKGLCFKKVKGHSGDKWNDRADLLANIGIEEHLLLSDGN